MTSQEKDKFICEKLELCWHDFNGNGCCRNCKQFRSEVKSNPDFTTEAGRVQLLKLIVKHEKYYDFCCDIGTGIFTIPVRYIEDDTGKFRDAVFKWLGGVE